MLIRGPKKKFWTVPAVYGAAAGGGGGSVAFDAVSSTSVAAGSSSTLSWTHTPVGTPTAVAVTLENYDGGQTVTGITYGGVSMELAVSQALLDSSVQIWGLANPPSGAQTVTITYSGSTTIYTQAAAITVTGSNTSTTFDASNSAGATNSSPSVSVTSATGELVIDVVGTRIALTETQGGSQTLRWGPLTVSTNVASGSSLPAGSGTTTMSWTLSGSDIWGLAAASFKK